MRILLTACGCLLALIGLKAQNITNAEYFIDEDMGIGKNIPIQIPVSNQETDISTGFTADLSVLTPGMHLLYVRTRDENHRWSLCATKPFQVISGEEIPDIVSAEYFIDLDPGIGQGIPIAIKTAAVNQSLAFSLNLSGYTLGLHTLYTRVKSSDNIWSMHNSRLFFITDVADIVKVTSLEYFFSGANGNTLVYVFDEFTPSQVVDFKESDFLANTSALEYNGQYTLHVRALNSNGKFSDYSTVQFTFQNLNTGNEDLNNSEIKVYPNPASEYIFFKGLPDGQRMTYFLYDQQGRVMTTGDLRGDRIATDGIPTGSYYLVVKEDSVLYGGTIIIK